jgi:NADH:ubiquinone oxidoreductase subunit H
MLYILLENLIKIVLIVVPLLIGLAYLTLAERKTLAAMQLRKGPNVVGVYGLLQPLADGVKLFSKETILPTHSNLAVFILAPIVGLILALVS